MRKLALLVVLALVVVVAAPAVAKRVVNESYTEYQIQAWMDSNNAWGNAWAIKGENGTDAGIDYDLNRDVDCEANPNAIVWMSIHGQATVQTFEVAPTNGKNKFTTGVATGIFTDGSRNIGRCDDSVREIPLRGKTFVIDMIGDGSLVKTTGSESWHVPSANNYHRNDRGLMRMATGTVTVGGWEWTGPGSIGRHSWSQHSNEN